MSTSDSSQADLIHDFQSDLHALITTIEQVGKYMTDDPEFCEQAIELAKKKGSRLFANWDALKGRLKQGGIEQ